MATYDLIATATFGVESIVADELRGLGYRDVAVENGKVLFAGEQKDIARCNLWLRTADRVVIRMAHFRATDFGELFERTTGVPWEEIIPINGKMHVTGKSHKSTLFSVPDCQSIVKKAIVEAMKRKHPVARFDETGPVYRIEVALLNDMATLTLDTTGPGLHKRGYRTEKGETPLRETLAAALVKLSRWTPGRDFSDPFCGSGTIAIEAGLIGKNLAPGLNRAFISEEWPDMAKTVWDEARAEARSVISREQFRILASDADGMIVRIAEQNATRAGLSEVISFQKQRIDEFSSSRKYGCIVCNPPYGERTGEVAEIENVYRTMGQVFRRLDDWSLFALTPHLHFERLFGRKAQRKRKLYNGNILCHLYQYLGPLPRKERKVWPLEQHGGMQAENPSLPE
jgi:putative N6-adenine-specific DNA methylase